MPKILLIDDDELFRDHLATLLERSGFRVRALSSGAGVLDLMESETYDAVVTDLFMPDVDGIEIVMSVRRRFPQIPVIGVTDSQPDALDNPCVAAMIRLGAAGVLHKPIDREELLRLLYRVLGRGSNLPSGRPAD